MGGFRSIAVRVTVGVLSFLAAISDVFVLFTVSVELLVSLNW